MIPRRRLKFIGCEIIYREACFLAATSDAPVDVEFLRKGLHDLETVDMVSKIQAAIDSVDPDAGYEAILLGYARCNDGLVGVTSRSIPLVLPRAHDCITFFFGSREAYRSYFDSHPGTYFLTTGWSERGSGVSALDPEGLREYDRPAYGLQGVMGKLGLTESYREMVLKYGKENADFLRDTLGDWMKNYSRFLYLHMDICDEKPFIEAAQKDAARRGWELETQKGDLALLGKLFTGPWDQDFVVVPPGWHVVARNNDHILDAEPAAAAGPGTDPAQPQP
ncbi:MAG TPA: DUF1638 domain-containing protein [Spirochaetia bacterium]|nr:DUF1638 domain-containing protein [Spirochaetia bacterium]